MSGQKRCNLAADFETTTNPDDCRVWAWGIADIATAEQHSDVEMGTDIDSFMDHVRQVSANVYFHNLKFDGGFILDWLFRNGFSHVGDKPSPGQFSSLISNMGAFYSITVKWDDGTVTEFRDSLKKLPFKVSVIAEMFNQPEPKGKLDYHAFRPVGHTLTPKEREYLAADVLIIARALREEFAAGMLKLTVGADSLAEFKKLTGEKMFTRKFPLLPDSTDAEIRRAYRGGFTYADPRFQGMILGRGRTYDVNSLYPSVMYDSLLPYGEPKWCEGLPSPTKMYPLFIVSVTFTARLKPGHIPCIQIKGDPHFLSTQYQTNIDRPVTTYISNVDLDLWNDHYDMDILSFNGGWQFSGTRGLFTKYIDKWMEVKMTSTGGMKAIAKLHLNSLYGKFATNPNVSGKIPTFNPDTDTVQLVDGPEETRDPVYTAMGVFITAYARDVTIRAAQENYDSFAYADTDSLHLLVDDDPIGLDVDPHKLGAWKREYVFESAIFLRAKAYMELATTCQVKDCDVHVYNTPTREHQVDCRNVIHVAGLPEEIAKKLSFEDFTNGRSVSGKLVPKRVPGGIVLTDTTYKLK